MVRETASPSPPFSTRATKRAAHRKLQMRGIRGACVVFQLSSIARLQRQETSSGSPAGTLSRHTHGAPHLQPLSPLPLYLTEKLEPQPHVFSVLGLSMICAGRAVR